MAKVANYFPDNYKKFNNIEQSFNELNSSELNSDELNSNFFHRELGNIEISSHNVSYNNIAFDIMRTSPYIIKALSNYFNVHWSGVFIPDYMFTNMISNELFDYMAKLKTVNLVHTMYQNKRMIDTFFYEYQDFSGINCTRDCKINVNNHMDIKFIYGMDHVLFMVSPYINMLIFTDMVIGIPANANEDEFFIMRHNMFYFSKNGNIGRYLLTDSNSISKQTEKIYDLNNIEALDSHSEQRKTYDTLQGMMIAEGKKEHIMIELDKDDNYIMNYNYHNSKNSMQVTYYSNIMNNGNIMEMHCKNKLLVGRYYDNTTKHDMLISQCMMNGDNGVRFRGKYVEEKQNGNIVKKELLKDDDTIYRKENGVVLIDMIKNIRIKDEVMIGWKVGKSANGENRIIKLMIPTDAHVIQPIDMEYHSTKGKQRCNKAIVMDIQFPDEGEEISIVPHEMVAYSSVYNNANNFEYKVGKEVTPDHFDDNNEISCTNGIHFYTNRHYVFDVYINRI